MDQPKETEASIEATDDSKAKDQTPTAEAEVELDLELERIDTEGVLKEGFAGQEM